MSEISNAARAAAMIAAKTDLKPIVGMVLGRLERTGPIV